MKCGREKGGHREHELGACPSYPEFGKQCARVAGTMCEDKMHGLFAAKLLSCLKCDFYNSHYYERKLGVKYE